MEPSILPAFVTAIGLSIAALVTALSTHVLNRKKHNKELEKLEVELQTIRVQATRSEITAGRAEDKANKALTQGKEYKDSSLVFTEMNGYIDDYFTKAPTMGVKTPMVNLKLLAVSMTFSWDGFITKWIPRLLREHPEATIEVLALVVDYEFLSTKALGRRYVDWVNRSKFHMREAVGFVEHQCPRFHPRLKFTLRAYRNIPHWHGWMINSEHLFLGRTDWDNSGELPILSVGTNKYRHFDTSEAYGAERITLFSNWHKYYFDHDSVEVCCFPPIS